VTPRVQANDLLIADIGADSGRARPSRHTGGDQPVVHRLVAWTREHRQDIASARADYDDQVTATTN
jgi:hypothetical protein